MAFSNFSFNQGFFYLPELIDPAKVIDILIITYGKPISIGYRDKSISEVAFEGPIDLVEFINLEKQNP